ncbi:hypothetical protein CYMTET_25610 [Cymbomonas tetramitiformis]|uniref:Uncharacterized protein n=1 Tax=Cymbomonas tetramitiformis TaxID=36881 RepID=A0AAE0FTJ6_9CHLO|nr:hypothetical protein CYMTET_25609 [Cymbomonas tetramitiformis]KAK3265754.1 hypothetical protein CYMTET_25610 [Cymbomonas tetramitiformis]
MFSDRPTADAAQGQSKVAPAAHPPARALICMLVDCYATRTTHTTKRLIAASTEHRAIFDGQVMHRIHPLCGGSSFSKPGGGAKNFAESTLSWQVK